MHPWNTEPRAAIITTRRHVLAHTVGHTRAPTAKPLYGTTPITAFATVVTTITVAAIKGQDGCSLSKIDSNKHLPENSANPKEQQTVFGTPCPTCVNNYTQSNHPSWVRGRSHTGQKPISPNETAINGNYTLFSFHLLYSLFIFLRRVSAFKYRRSSFFISLFWKQPNEI